MFKKWLSMIVVMVFTVCLAGCGDSDFRIPKQEIEIKKGVEEFERTENYILCGEDGQLELYVKPSTTAFYVKNKTDDSVWYSSPEKATEDMFADGTYRMEMLSNLIVSCENSETQASSRFNSYTGSVIDGDYQITKLEKGFRVDYHFKESDTTIPLCVYLSEGALVTEVVAEEITSKNEEIHLGDISVCPFFGAGGTEDEGYLFVADASGGIINFNNGKTLVAPYERPVYGEDKTKAYERYDLELDELQVAMPVFGIQKNESAFVAIIEGGAANAYLCANVNMQQTSYANVYSRFRLYETLDYEIGSVKAPVYESGDIESPIFSNRYYFLTGEEANYNGMAAQYRSYLMEEYQLTEQEKLDAAIYIELYGGVKKTVSNVGIQTQETVALTTTSQVEEIAELLKAQGVSELVIQYQNWNEDAMKNKSVHKGKVDKKINDGDTTFQDLLLSQEFTFYPALPQLLTFEKGNVIQKLFGTAADISGVSVKNHTYAPGIGTALEKKDYYFLTASSLLQELQKTENAMKKLQLKQVAFSDIGNLVYNDFRDGNLRRANMQILLEKGLSEYSKNYQLMLNNPNVYAIPYATEIFRVPTTSSGHDLLDEEVPFYNMVVSGLIRTAAAPFNNSAVGEDSFLKALETGSMVSYTWLYEDAVLVKNTDLSFLSESNYESYLETAVSQYKVTREIAEKAGSGTIKSHEKIAEGVYCLTYETGLRVYVNYNEAAYETEEGQIGPKAWLLSEGGIE